jgi:Low-density lipoprotein receptor repeat class B
MLGPRMNLGLTPATRDFVSALLSRASHGDDATVFPCTAKRLERHNSSLQNIAVRRLVFLTTLVLVLARARPIKADVVYFANNGSEIDRVNLDGTQKVSLVSGLHGPLGLALDASGNKIYWADSQTGDIGRANLNDGSNPTIIIKNLNVPIGVALDAGVGRIYWANAGTSTIGWADLSDNIPHTLYHTNFVDPQGVALDVAGGKIYWTDFSGGAIERGNLDGTGAPTTLLSGLNIGLGGPNGIALELAGCRLYWVNGGSLSFGQLGFIGRANLDGSGMTALVSAAAPIGIALDMFHSKIYWGTLSANNDLEMSNLDGTGKMSLLTGLSGASYPALGLGSVPEPASLVLTILGGATIVGGIRRQWKNALAT